VSHGAIIEHNIESNIDFASREIVASVTQGAQQLPMTTAARQAIRAALSKASKIAVRYLLPQPVIPLSCLV
jgi:hypothetical protein